MPLLDAIAGAIAACHCEKQVTRVLHRSPLHFFSALITHKNWLVLSGVYAGIILVVVSLLSFILSWRSSQRIVKERKPDSFLCVICFCAMRGNIHMHVVK